MEVNQMKNTKFPTKINGTLFKTAEEYDVKVKEEAYKMAHFLYDMYKEHKEKKRKANQEQKLKKNKDRGREPLS
jgi:transcriptional regulator